MSALRCCILAAGMLALPCAAEAGEDDVAAQVRATEAAFASTMAERDLEAFRGFLDPEAVFFNGAEADRGKQAVSARWAAYFEGETAPFSWAPETVAVLDSGSLALSSGPVYDPSGARVATFTSVWRLSPDGRWLIVFDKGARYCDPPGPDEAQ